MITAMMSNSRSKFNRRYGSNPGVIPEYKLCLLGSLGVGKSALTVKFITRRFINEYDPTLEDTYTKEDVIDNHMAILKVMDTAHEDQENMERYLRWSDAIVVVYSITSKQSFQRAKALLQEIAEIQKAKEITESPVVLLGNKNEMERYRQVSKLDGAALSKQYTCSYHEVSAAGEYSDVEGVFHETVREIKREQERLMPLDPLFISEDKSLSSSLTHLSTKDRTRMATSPKAPKVLPKRTVHGFKFFNKGFKIF